MKYDVHLLNNAILDVVELDFAIEHADTDFNLTAQWNDIHMSVDNQWTEPEPVTAELPSMGQDSSWRSSLLPTTEQMPHSNGNFMDGLDALENSFTFDMEDLKWLDSVQ